jgi:hypothetical protein
MLHFTFENPIELTDAELDAVSGGHGGHDHDKKKGHGGGETQTATTSIDCSEFFKDATVNGGIDFGSSTVCSSVTEVVD